MKKFQRDHDLNQQVAKSVRPQLPRDGHMDGRAYFKPGELPKGGYNSMWCFDGNHKNTKDSPTRGDGKKVY